MRIESLETRKLMSGSALLAAGDGVDLQFLSDLTTDTTPVVNESPESFPRVEMEGGFQWFDSTHDQDLIAHGGNLDFVLVDGWNMWPRDNAGNAIRTGEPSEANTRFMANYAVTVSDLVVIDIENWAMDIRYYSQDVVNQNIARFVNMISWIRDEQPDLKVGIYSLFPVSDLYNSVQYQLYAENAVDPVTGAWYRVSLPGVANSFAKLQNSNAFLSGLAEQVDYVFPALYTSSADIDLWHRYATSSVAEARRYGKPVIPFLMPTYHAAATNMNQAVVSPEMWQHQLDLMPEIADAAIIWTDPYAPTGGDEYWIQMAINKINGTTPQSVPQNTGLGSTYDRFVGVDAKSDDDDRFSAVLIEELT